MSSSSSSSSTFSTPFLRGTMPHYPVFRYCGRFYHTCFSG
jgi:hypothetical protein